LATLSHVEKSNFLHDYNAIKSTYEDIANSFRDNNIVLHEQKDRFTSMLKQLRDQLVQ